MPRSGHSACIYKNYMLLFGGIFEITKELNDLYLYDLEKNKWIQLFEETSSPKKGGESSFIKSPTKLITQDVTFDSSSPGLRNSRISPVKNRASIIRNYKMTP